MSTPELAGAERDAEIGRLAREFPEDGAFSREIRDAAGLPVTRERVIAPEVTRAFFSAPRAPEAGQRRERRHPR